MKDDTKAKTQLIPFGCYISSGGGIYNIEYLHELVADIGVNLPSDFDELGEIIHHSLYGEYDSTMTTTDGEITVSEAQDIASEEWDGLTELLPVTDDGAIWSWEDGELFYQRAEWFEGYHDV